jgi:hypothetical protein
MRLYDVGQQAQNIVDSNQKEEEPKEKDIAYDKFSDFKV